MRNEELDLSRQSEKRKEEEEMHGIEIRSPSNRAIHIHEQSIMTSPNEIWQQ
jgi:hypothetical protein